MKRKRSPAPKMILLDDLPHSAEAHRFIGADHGAPVSMIFVHAPAGGEPTRAHRHPYPEVWIVQEGEATFDIGDRQVVAGAGHILVGPANVKHRFTNTGSTPLRLISVHGAGGIVAEE
jgi:mannose-6-phosphate isomerase-like protein (cupin superfamily)